MFVKAELTMAPGVEDIRCSDIKKLLSLQVGKIRRAFGFKPARLPEKPDIVHPLECLTFRGGTICQIRHGQILGEYMPLSGVEVVRKLSLKELFDERCEYRFELNLVTDPIWRCFFGKLLPEIPIQFEGNALALVCLPATLERSYRRIKEAIAQANLWYAQEREQLIPRIVARDEQRLAAREMELNRKIGLRRQFDHLQV